MLADHWRSCDKPVNEQEKRQNTVKEKAQTHKDNDKKEVIDLCGESQTMTSDHWKVEQKEKVIKV